MSTSTLAGPHSPATGRHPSATRRLIGTEIVLMVRDPLTLAFVFAFPVITMLIVGGSFGRAPDPAFEGVDPAHWYVASYLTVVIGATGLVTLPVHIASYAERGVLRRFGASGFPRWSFALAQLSVAVVTIALGMVLLLAVAVPVYGLPEVHSWWRVVAGVIAGAVAFAGLGTLLGTVLPSARSAQAVGLMLFFPSFLIGVGGPPPAVMGEALKSLSDVLPLALVTRAVRDPWLGLGDATGSLIAVTVLAVVSLALALRRTAL